jgi:hypothetical protein
MEELVERFNRLPAWSILIWPHGKNHDLLKQFPSTDLTNPKFGLVYFALFLIESMFNQRTILYVIDKIATELLAVPKNWVSIETSSKYWNQFHCVVGEHPNFWLHVPLNPAIDSWTAFKNRIVEPTSCR